MKCWWDICRSGEQIICVFVESQRQVTVQSPHFAIVRSRYHIRKKVVKIDIILLDRCGSPTQDMRIAGLPIFYSGRYTDILQANETHISSNWPFTTIPKFPRYLLALFPSDTQNRTCFWIFYLMHSEYVLHVRYSLQNIWPTLMLPNFLSASLGILDTQKMKEISFVKRNYPMNKYRWQLGIETLFRQTGVKRFCVVERCDEPEMK